MTDIKSEQQTVSQVYRELPKIDRMLYKTFIDLMLILWERRNLNEQS